MSWFEAIVLGLVQGLTEFLPISSSAHLRITAALAGWHDPGAAFTAVTQIGTETAVLLYFRRDIGRIISTWVRSLGRPELRSHLDARMGWLVIVGTIPIGVLGVTLKETIEGPFRDLRLIAATLIVLGIILGVADRFATQRLKLDDLSVRDGLLFGLAQSMALIPGVSRSGATITGGLLLGYTREAAARYSFLLAIPAVLASGFFELSEIGDSHVSWGPTIVATLIAFLVGYAAIAWFLRYISTRSFAPFVIYRIALGVLILVLVGTGVLAPESGAFH
ncbi:undecaprenyl-diphosphate phosphatase [Carbonactinospora thermoautotrophica]|uniref:Undecaprenyl-diphosphatase n=1 Tax=Carbonactinospora thermoautotrophica TaxID=1469144 RepID=A0A132NCP0_9ACTN|nr:undecaprenyl-diphosphate phosphatase [Carbonactinospora thermoautotrophica]KWW97883.1 UDP pyrophosphate phosphatase [Carbonactinospora thermoautotrophica]KWX07342.1 UDP pyrophosphate phosphatase [Carbonactinospora thermoautotrophica]MCX9191973.1 undecaprenyl-diphosphate phosphatase [Carbonactinospora thermoautotrophica]